MKQQDILEQFEDCPVVAAITFISAAKIENNYELRITICDLFQQDTA